MATFELRNESAIVGRFDDAGECASAWIREASDGDFSAWSDLCEGLELCGSALRAA